MPTIYIYTYTYTFDNINIEVILGIVFLNIKTLYTKGKWIFHDDEDITSSLISLREIEMTRTPVKFSILKIRQQSP